MVYIAYRKKKNPHKLNSKISYMYFKIPDFWVKMGKFATLYSCRRQKE